MQQNATELFQIGLTGLMRGRLEAVVHHFPVLDPVEADVANPWRLSDQAVITQIAPKTASSSGQTTRWLRSPGSAWEASRT